MLALLNQLAVSFDLPILDWIQAHLQCGFLDAVMPIVTLFGEGGIFWIAWAVLMLVFPKTRKTGIAMAIALIMGVLICNVTLKPLIGRPLPFFLFSFALSYAFALRIVSAMRFFC